MIIEKDLKYFSIPFHTQIINCHLALSANLSRPFPKKALNKALYTCILGLKPQLIISRKTASAYEVLPTPPRAVVKLE
ncbi:hypothetical protein LguiB_003867 [Lonicera macranthoides]